LGVIVTLIFIAREFTRNASHANLASVANAIETQVRQFAHLADEPQKADLVRRALRDFDGLNQGEKGRMSAIIHDIMLSHDVVRRAHASGQMADEDFHVMQELWVSLIRTTGWRQWWAGWKGIMPKAVVAYVEAAVDDPRLTTKPLYDEVPWLFALEPSQAPGQTTPEVKRQ
jgi:hypothetical protein